MTVLRDSIHMGSISPSRTGLSVDMLERSRMIQENKPGTEEKVGDIENNTCYNYNYHCTVTVLKLGVLNLIIM